MTLFGFPDFIVCVKTDPPVYVILETKGYHELEGVKSAVVGRWVKAVNSDGKHDHRGYRFAHRWPAS
jgi:type III restriction enzyme